MNECLFCQIVAGTKPAHKIYEDDQFLAFLDAFPSVYGHTLIIPKKHYRWVWDMENPGELLNIAKKLTFHYKKVLNVETCFVNIYGLKVAHAHMHLKPLPSGAGEELGTKSSPVGQLSEEEGNAISQRLRLSTTG